MHHNESAFHKKLNSIGGPAPYILRNHFSSHVGESLGRHRYTRPAAAAKAAQRSTSTRVPFIHFLLDIRFWPEMMTWLGQNSLSWQLSSELTKGETGWLWRQRAASYSMLLNQGTYLLPSFDNLSSFPRTHMVEGEHWLPKVFLWPLYVYVVCIDMYILTHMK